MKRSLFISLFLIGIFVISSCSIDIAKRRYSRGWNIGYFQSKGMDKAQNAKIKYVKTESLLVDIIHDSLAVDVDSTFVDTGINDETDSVESSNSYTLVNNVDTVGQLIKSDTIISAQMQEEDIKALELAQSKVNYIHLFAVIIFVITMLAAIAAGSVSVGIASPFVINLFLAGMAFLSVLFPMRFIKIFRLLNYLTSVGPSSLDSSNPYQEEQLKKRFRLMVNSVFFFPIGSLVMSIILYRKLKPKKGEEPSELNAFLRKMAARYIFYSIISLALWSYLCIVTFPFLVSVLLMSI